MARVACLRSVNVSGYGRLLMADLRSVAESLGLREIRTVVQTGNLVFESDGADTELEIRLERALAETLDFGTDVLVRSAAEWAGLVAKNPFPEVAERAPAMLHVMLLRDRVDPKGLDGIVPAGAPERAAAGDRHLYLHYPDGAGRSRLTSARIERYQKQRGTARNWNTVRNIANAL